MHCISLKQLTCVRGVQRRTKDGVKALGLDGGLPVVQGDDVVQNTQRRKNDAEVWEDVEHQANGTKEVAEERKQLRKIRDWSY